VLTVALSLFACRFEYGFNHWHADGSSLSDCEYGCGNYSAKIGNSKVKPDKTYLEQAMLDYTPTGCFEVSFCFRSSPDWSKAKSFMDVQFNHVQLGTPDEVTEGTGPFPPVKSLNNYWGNWTCVLFNEEITTGSLINDLRIRFHGHGFLVDYVTVKEADKIIAL
jgi:hypothetical protein